MTMTIDHPRFPEFLERLSGPEGINLQPNGSSEEIRPTDTSKTVTILIRMGLSDDEVRASLAYFAARGGFNDREIVLDVGITAGDQAALDATEPEDR